MILFQWIVVALLALAQIFERVRSDRAHKAEIAAKDAELAAKASQIEILRELTSVQVREHYLATKAQLEEYIEKLKSEIKLRDETSERTKERFQTLLDELSVQLGKELEDLERKYEAYLERPTLNSALLEALKSPPTTQESSR